LNRKIQNILWYLVPLLIVISKWWRGPSSYNNFVIYKQSFWHLLHQSNLYQKYPSEYFDQFLYGPLFAVLVAPFAILPDVLAMSCWIFFSMWVLQKGLSYFFNEHPPITFFLCALLEAATSVHNLQFNILIAGGLLWAFALVKQEKDWASALLIIVLMLTKIYGVVGLIVVFFSKRPLHFTTYCFFWAIVGLLLPAVFSSLPFVYQSYIDWYQAIVHKNDLNQISYSNGGLQDISAMGLFKRISGYYQLSNLVFLIPAGILTLSPLLRVKLLSQARFQIDYFAQVLIGLVIFSSSSESSTYIVAVCGFIIWMKDDYKNRSWSWLFILLFLLTLLSPTDLVPPYIRREIIVKYALKALPLFITWILITKQLIFDTYQPQEKHAS